MGMFGELDNLSKKQQAASVGQHAAPPTAPSDPPPEKNATKKMRETTLKAGKRSKNLHIHHLQEKIEPALPSLPAFAEISAQRDTAIPCYRDTMTDTTVARYHDTIIETARRAVKQLGKEAATHRFTVEEKKALKAIERTYEEQDIRTSENEITRISINYIIEDYRQHGENSILARVLKQLNA